MKAKGYHKLAEYAQIAIRKGEIVMGKSPSQDPAMQCQSRVRSTTSMDPGLLDRFLEPPSVFTRSRFTLTLLASEFTGLTS